MLEPTPHGLSLAGAVRRIEQLVHSDARCIVANARYAGRSCRSETVVDVVALVVAGLAMLMAGASVWYARDISKVERERRMEERRPVVEARYLDGRVEFRAVDGAALAEASVSFPQVFIADFESVEGVGDWGNVRHDSADLAHPIEHGRWWSLPRVDRTGEVTFTLYCHDDGDSWEVTRTVHVPGPLTDGA